MKEKEKRLLKGIARVLASVAAAALVMTFTGHYASDAWILKLSAAVLPWYWVYKIYIEPEYAKKS